MVALQIETGAFGGKRFLTAQIGGGGRGRVPQATRKGDMYQPCDGFVRFIPSKGTFWGSLFAQGANPMRKFGGTSVALLFGAPPTLAHSHSLAEVFAIVCG